MSGKNPLGNGREPQSYEGLNVIVPIGGWQLIKSPRAPTTNDKKYPVGSIWVDTATNAGYILTSAPGNWSLFGSSSGGAINSITGDTGGAELPSAGNFNILGTANQIAVTGSANTETLSLIGPYTPSTYTSHGVLVGAGTSSIVALSVGTTGQVLIGSTGANPAFGALGVNSGLTAHGVLLAENNSAFVASAAGTNGQLFIASTGADPAFSTPTSAGGTIAFTLGAHTLALDVVNGGMTVNAASAGVTLVAQNVYTVTQAGQASFALPATATPGQIFTIASAQSNTAGWIITQASGQEIWLNTNHTTSGATGTLAGAKSTAVVLMCTVANVEFIVIGGTGVTGLTFT